MLLDVGDRMDGVVDVSSFLPARHGGHERDKQQGRRAKWTVEVMTGDDGRVVACGHGVVTKS